MRTADTIVIGGGIIGLSLALALRRYGARVIVIERGEPGREASHAAAGMLACCDPHTPPVLRPLLQASAHLYPGFVRDLQQQSSIAIDFRPQGTIALAPDGPSICPDARPLQPDELRALEPALGGGDVPAEFWPESSVDPRTVVSAAVAAAKQAGVEVVHGSTVTEVVRNRGRAAGVNTDKSAFACDAVVNCAGAWAAEIMAGVPPIPTRPVKGQMLAVVPAKKNFIRHVVRAPEVYLVPRSDGRLLLGATVEEAGFDKRVDAAIIQRLHAAAIRLLPALASARILEDWAGLRPGTPDGLPILGATSLPGYFVATGHFRDGILLAPITAQIVAQVLAGEMCEFDLTPFSPLRFAGPARPLTREAV